MVLHDDNSKLGTELSPEERKRVLGMYPLRYTRDNVPKWARCEWKDGKTYPVQFASDAEWLANTRFAVTRQGRLNERATYCQSSPTWPDNPELRPQFGTLGSKAKS